MLVMEEIEDKPKLWVIAAKVPHERSGVPHHLTVDAGRDRKVPPPLGVRKVPQPLVIGKFIVQRHCTSVGVCDGEIGRY
jgi:hypothetical protein